MIAQVLQTKPMKVVLLTHPHWLDSASMLLFPRMIDNGMRERGHQVSMLTVSPVLSRIGCSSAFVRKWIRYVDQFAIFPRRLRRIVQTSSPDTLFVVTDQALGMWVPQLRDRPHVVHCHDFLALRSALGEFPENTTSWTGKKYQSLIQSGFSQANHFISVSRKTQQDLQRLISRVPVTSHVVHNGLNHTFKTIEANDAKNRLRNFLTHKDEAGFLLNVGGNQWYKNRIGTVLLYKSYRELTDRPLPLWLVGAGPDDALKKVAGNLVAEGHVRFHVGLNDDQVIAAYNLAKLFLFPSLEEGFGWPIAEAMACGAPVLTTDSSPMTEVGGDVAIYQKRLQIGEEESWAIEGAKKIVRLLNQSKMDRSSLIQKGFTQASQFTMEKAIDQYERIYRCVLSESYKRTKSEIFEPSLQR